MMWLVVHISRRCLSCFDFHLLHRSSSALGVGAYQDIKVFNPEMLPAVLPPSQMPLLLRKHPWTNTLPSLPQNCAVHKA